MDRSEFPPCCSGVKEPISVEYSSLGPPVFPSMTLAESAPPMLWPLARLRTDSDDGRDRSV